VTGLIRAPRVLLVGAVVCTLLSAACAGQSAQPNGADNVSVEWTLTPRIPVEGGAALATIVLRDRDVGPVRGVSLRIEGHMAHPGMAPIVATAAERADGVYEVPLRFPMRGDWILTVTGALRDGREISHRVDLTAEGPDG
jgi:hypothetical protein